VEAQSDEHDPRSTTKVRSNCRPTDVAASLDQGIDKPNYEAHFPQQEANSANGSPASR